MYRFLNFNDAWTCRMALVSIGRQAEVVRDGKVFVVVF
jgi:hypothetical protein